MTTRRILWYAAAALAAVVLATLVLEARTIVTGSASRAAATDGTAGSKRDHDEPPEARAARLREEARAACRESAWRKCENKLNHALRLDPSGESSPRVKDLRAALAKAPADDRAAETHNSQP